MVVYFDDPIREVFPVEQGNPPFLVRQLLAPVQALRANRPMPAKKYRDVRSGRVKWYGCIEKKWKVGSALIGRNRLRVSSYWLSVAQVFKNVFFMRKHNLVCFDTRTYRGAKVII